MARKSTPAPPPHFSAGRPLVALVAAVATAAAIAERWAFGHAWGEAGSLTSAFYFGDAPRLVDYAVAIRQGRLFDNGIPFHPPGWPLVLAGFLQAAGAAPSGDGAVPVGAVKLLLAVVSGLSVGLSTLLAFEIAGFGAMLAVALLGPFHFGHIVEGTVAVSEPLYGLLVVGAALATWHWVRDGARGRLAWAAGAGALSGLAMLVRAEFVAGALVLMAAAGWWRRWRGTQLGAFIVLWLVVLTPTTVWHWRTLSAFNASHVGRVAGAIPRFAPVTSYGPFNFAMANHEDADGGPNRDHPMLDRCSQEDDAALGAGQLDLACPAIYDLYVHGYAIGARWLVTQPAAAVALMNRKVSLTAGFLAQGYFVDDVGAGIDGTRRRVDMLDPDRRWLLSVHLTLVVAGLWVLRRRPIALAVVAAPLMALVGSTLLFYGYVRLGVAYLPLMWVAQGAALSAAASRLAGRGRARRGTAIAVVAAIALLAGLDLLRVNAVRRLSLDGPRDPSGQLIQDETLEVREVRQDGP